MSLNKSILALALATSLVAGCQNFTKRQNIGATCLSAASALRVITLAHANGKATDKQHDDAIALYKVAVKPVCSPVVESLSSIDYNKLIDAAAELALTRAAVQP